DAADIPSLAAHYLLVPVGMTIQAGLGILVPGGMGVGEWGYGLLYESAGFEEAAGVFGSLVKRVIEWGLGLSSYLVYLRMKPQLAAQTPVNEKPTVSDPLSVVSSPLSEAR